jgi:hypothetical protein
MTSRVEIYETIDEELFKRSGNKSSNISVSDYVLDIQSVINKMIALKDFDLNHPYPALYFRMIAAACVLAMEEFGAKHAFDEHSSFAKEFRKMPLVIIESPLSGDFKRNKRYALLCMRDCLKNYNEAPYASHLLYTQMLDDQVEEERELGMLAGFEWAKPARKRVVYQDLGISGGMERGIKAGEDLGQKIEYRKLPEDLMKMLDTDEPVGATEAF